MKWQVYLNKMREVIDKAEELGFSSTLIKLFRNYVEENEEGKDVPSFDMRSSSWEEIHTEMVRFIILVRLNKGENAEERGWLTSLEHGGHYTVRKRKELDLSLRHILVLEEL